MTDGLVPFVHALRTHGGRLAVVAADGAVALTYTELAERVEATATRLGDARDRRRLVLVAAENDLDTLVGYLAVLHAGHVALPAARRDPRLLRTLAARYDPDLVLPGDGAVVERHARPAHLLHPDLALLLATSGSTGSPKLVRLSGAGVQANAGAIASYLGIRTDDRAVAGLPLHYCYGLSIVHSNLATGAALLLTGRTVTDPAFWDAFRALGGTSLSGVPYTFELLDQAGFPRMRLPGLRYVTQAGGPLPPSTVRRYAELGARDGWDLVVMYGQTEATARMAYLPPHLARTSPSAIGVAVPGGSLEVAGDGELVYRGPNVMLGYAHAAADLARGREVTALHTGDLGRRRPDGLFEITGRRSRIAKPFGLRIDLDRVERLLAGEDVTASVSGTGDRLTVAVARGPDPRHVRALVAGRLGLPAGGVRVVPLARLPRRENGKVDHAAAAALAHRCRLPRWLRPGSGRPPSCPERAGRWPSCTRRRTVRDAFRRVLPGADVTDDATFVSLGGDSLSYVQMTVALQNVLGTLPPDWERTPVGVLERSAVRRGPWAEIETAVLLRAIAIVLVVVHHARETSPLVGGAHLLLAMAGWAFARFVLAPSDTSGPRSRAILRSLARIAVPSALWISYRAVASDDVRPENALLLNYVLDPAAWGYWYVETLSQILLALAVLFAVPAVRRLERARPFGFALGLLGVAMIGRLFPDGGNEFSARLMSPHLLLWLFALGWLVARARRPEHVGLTAVLVVLLVPGFFDLPMRGVIVVAGLLALLLVPRTAVPRVLVRPIGTVAAASLAIYLTHYAVLDDLEGRRPLVVVAVALAVGIAVRWVAGRGVRLLGHIVESSIVRAGVRTDPGGATWTRSSSASTPSATSPSTPTATASPTPR